MHYLSHLANCRPPTFSLGDGLAKPVPASRAVSGVGSCCLDAIMKSLWAMMFLIAGVAAVTAQERPLSLRATMSSGFYSTFSRDVVETRLSVVPVSLDLAARGYIGDPGFFSYSVRPMLSVGPQASEAGLLGGNGVAADTTILGGRSFPLKLRYANIKREDVFFGSLNQVSGYRSINHEKVLGLNWQLRARHLPQLSVDLNRSDLSTDPGVSIIPSYSTVNRGYALTLHDERGGWNIDADARRTVLKSNFGALGPEGLITTRMDQDLDHAGAVVHKELGSAIGLTFTGGATKNQNRFDSHPYIQNLRYVDGSMNLSRGTRWRGRLRVGYNDNRLGADMSSNSSLPTAATAPESSPLYAVQVGAFADINRAEALRERMEARFGRAAIVTRPDQPALSRVVVGQEVSRTAADALAARLRQETGGAFVVPLAANGGDAPAATAPAPTAGPGPTPLVSYRNRFSSISLEAENRLQLTKGWSIFASAHRERIVPQQDSLGVIPSDYVYGSAGVALQHRFSWATFSGQADISLGRMVYAGLPNRFQGHSWSLNAQRGTIDRLELGVSYNNSRQRTRQLTTLDSGTNGGELSIGRRFAGIAFRTGAGLSRSHFRDPVLDYRSTGLTFRVALQFRFLDASYSRNRSAGNALSVYFATSVPNPSAASFILAPPLRATAYANTGDTLVLRANPLRRLSFNFTLVRGVQLFGDQSVNNYAQMEARASYQFRLLSFEAGYIRYRQDLMIFSNTLRSRYYYRISRTFGIIGAQ